MAGPGGTIRLRVIELERDGMTVQNGDGSIGHSQRCDGQTPTDEVSNQG
jgi:hypothetical protein